MTSNWLEYAIIVFIIVSIGAVIWRGGSANPEGTGSLGRKVVRLDGDVRKFGGQVAEVERRLAEIERSTAKVSDIKRLERGLAESDGKIDELIKLTAAQTAAAEHRGKQLDMLYQTIVMKGMQQ